MARATIDIDDELVREAMRRFGLKTKREAVDLALRRLVVPVMSVEEMRAMEGSGWYGDLGTWRNDAPRPSTTGSPSPCAATCRSPTATPTSPTSPSSPVCARST